MSLHVTQQWQEVSGGFPWVYISTREHPLHTGGPGRSIELRKRISTEQPAATDAGDPLLVNSQPKAVVARGGMLWLKTMERTSAQSVDVRLESWATTDGTQCCSDSYTSTYPGFGDAVQALDGTWSGTDHTATLRTWIAELDARGRADALVIKGRIPRGKYLFTGTLITTTDRYQNLDIGGDGDETVLVNNNPNGAGFLVAGDSTGQETSTDMFLTAPAAVRDQSVTVNTTAGLVVGQWIILRDPSQPFIFDRDITEIGMVGQAIRIEAIAGNVIDLDGSCEYDYNATSTVVVRYTTANNMYFHNLAFEYGPAVAVNGYAIEFSRCSNPRVENIKFKGRKSRGLRFIESFVFTADGIRDDGATNLAEYTVECQNSHFGIVRGVVQQSGRHAFDAGGDKDWIPSSHITVSDSMSISTNSNGFDTHENCRNITFDGVRATCQANASAEAGAGVLVRGRSCRVINSEFEGYGIGVYMAIGGDGEVKNNVVRRCTDGIRLGNVDRTIVSDNLVADCAVSGVYLYSVGAGIVVENNTITGPIAGGEGIHLTNTVWDPTWIIRGNRIPDAAIPYHANIPPQITSFVRSTAADYTLKIQDGSSIPGVADVESPRRVIERAVGSGTNTVTIPTHATVPIPVGSRLEVVQTAAGSIVISPDVGVTLNGLTTPIPLPGQYGMALLRQRAADDWLVAMVPNIIRAQVTYDPPSLVDGASDTTTVALPRAVLGDFATASFNKDLVGVALAAWVSAADTVSVRFSNRTGGTVNLAPGQLRAWVIRS